MTLINRWTTFSKSVRPSDAAIISEWPQDGITLQLVGDLVEK
jgi:hypothetical protein